METTEILPRDEHNSRLLSNVHPPRWVNPRPSGRYNLVVVGGGTAGLVSAAGAAGIGAKVALVERQFMGGDCLNAGCVPSKAIIRSSRAAFDAADARRFGVVPPPGSEVDFGAVMERMRNVRAGISGHDSAARFRDELGIDVYIGEGRFAGTDCLEVEGSVLTFSKAVIATGARAFPPPIPGLAETGFLTNETLFSLTERPKRLAVIGAGPIGCEMAQAFRRLGSEVCLLDMNPDILSREDPDAAGIVADAFVREGIQLILGCRLERVEALKTGKRITLSCAGEESIVDADEILVGAGRMPNVEGLGLERAGVVFDPKKGVGVDDRLRTSNPRIYAAGDVCLPYQFTHTADAAARIVIENALFWGRRKFSDLVVPWCTYTDPEIAHVGLYEEDAKRSGLPVDTYTVPFTDVDRAVLDGESEGMVRVHVRKGKDRIVGATIVARHAGEMISEISVAMAAGTGLGALSGVIHPYPTQAEAIRKAGDLYRRTRLTPGIRKLFDVIMKLQRGR